MDLGNIPPALVRSGRIELWLEMKFPVGESRRRLLEKLFADKVLVENESIWPDLERATADFSGADLKRLVQDAKLRLAVDMTRQRPVQAFQHHLFESAKSIREARHAYARAAQRAITPTRIAPGRSKCIQNCSRIRARNGSALNETSSCRNFFCRSLLVVVKRLWFVLMCEPLWMHRSKQSINDRGRAAVL